MRSLKSLSQQHLEDAVRLGYITLENGDVRELTAVQIIQISRYILKEGLVPETQTKQGNMPTEMLLSPPANEADPLCQLGDDYAGEA